MLPDTSPSLQPKISVGYKEYKYQKGKCQETAVIQHLKSWKKELNRDKKGNLFIIKPNTILLCAHMDTVGSYTAQCHVDNIGIFKDEELKEDVICGSHNIGADDKCGIAIAMELYEKYPERFSLLFTVQEESGGGGVKEFIKNNPDLLAKVNYCVIADRKGSEDIIGADNDYCSKEFETRVTEALLMY